MLMTILLRLVHQAPPAAAPAHADIPGDVEAAQDRPLGCGWYDSSHELHNGLVITEHASADAVAADLPLSDWLGLTLEGGGRRPAAEVGLA